MTLNRRHHVRVGERKEFLFLLSASSAALAEPAQEPVRKRDYLPALRNQETISLNWEISPLKLKWE